MSAFDGWVEFSERESCRALHERDGILRVLLADKGPHAGAWFWSHDCRGHIMPTATGLAVAYGFATRDDAQRAADEYDPAPVLP